MKLTAKEVAEKLHNTEYPMPNHKDLWAEMKEANLVVVFGASDDLVELRGAIYDELDAEDFAILEGCIYKNDCSSRRDCPNFNEDPWGAVDITVSEDVDGYFFAYNADFPHEVFDVVEEGEKYCRGIVFSLHDLEPPLQKNPEIEKLKKDIQILKADLEEYRTYVHNGVWAVLDAPNEDPLLELKKHRAAFGKGKYDPASASALSEWSQQAYDLLHSTHDILSESGLTEESKILREQSDHIVKLCSERPALGMSGNRATE